MSCTPRSTGNFTWRSGSGSHAPLSQHLTEPGQADVFAASFIAAMGALIASHGASHRAIHGPNAGPNLDPIHDGPSGGPIHGDPNGAAGPSHQPIHPPSRPDGLGLEVVHCAPCPFFTLEYAARSMWGTL